MSRFEKYCDLKLNTPRLVLRILDPTWAPMVLDYHLENREFFQNSTPIPRPQFWTLDFQAQKLQQDQARLLEKQQIKLWIFAKTSPQLPIGHLTFSNLVWGGFLSCFLGYGIAAKQTGQGFATEALEKGVAFIFEEVRLHRIEANIMPNNRASIRVVEKLGFDYEGLSPKYLKINGRWEDHLHYAKRNLALE